MKCTKRQSDNGENFRFCTRPKPVKMGNFAPSELEPVLLFDLPRRRQRPARFSP
jgi:hypothetical protein